MDDSTPTPTWRWPELRRRWVLWTLAFFLAMGLWRSATVVLDFRASGSRTPWMEPVVWELTSHLVTWALLPLAQVAALNAPWSMARWRRAFGFHLLGALLYWLLHLGGMWTTRILIYRLAGWGSYDYGNMLYRAPMEGFKDLISFLSFALVFQTIEAFRAKQARELALAKLEAELREAQLQALSAQLDPHFLFNALNTLSSVIYEDVERADGLIADLGLMLRDNLQASGPTWPLQRELEHLEHYLAFVRARFGDRIRVDLEVEPSLRTIPVPRFALQRLVENALKHNESEAGRTLSIQVLARRERDAASLRVTDDGVGFVAGGSPGVGLDNLRRSLALLHGGRATLRAENGTKGGAEVELTLPLEVGRG